MNNPRNDDMTLPENTLDKNQLNEQFIPKSEFATETPAKMAISAASILDPKKYPEAPFAYSMTDSETVNMVNGSYMYSFSDISLPGRNGFDCNIIRRYDSNNANLQDINPQVYAGGVQTAQRPNFHNNRQYGLGFGWYFVLPSIEITPESERDANVTYSMFMHMEDGRNFEIVGNSFKDYSLQDVTISQQTGSLVHPWKSGVSKNYDIVISYKNGNKDYFKKYFDSSNRLDSYKLVARRDRFENAIFFELQDYGGMTIIDTWGRTISLEKSGNSMCWKIPSADGTATSVSYIFDNETTARKLVRVVDEMDRTTLFEYYDPEQYKAVSKVADSTHGDNTSLYFEYQLLKKITHPTGGVTHYEYNATQSPLQISINEYGGFRRYFPLKKRYDQITDSSESEKINLVEYTYTLASDAKYINQTAVAKLDNVSETHAFNSLGLLTQSKIMHSNQLVETRTFTYGTVATACDYKQLTQEIITSQINTPEVLTVSKTTATTYTDDKKLNISSVSETYSENSSLNKVTSYTYGPYSILTEKSVQKEASTTLYERYTLRSTPDNKVVEFARIFENQTLKAKKQYIYSQNADDKYCLTQEKVFYADAGADLESSTLYHVKTSVYNSAKFTHAPVSVTIGGIKDADGNTLADVTTTYNYDERGRTISQTSPNGNTTDYVYDKAGNLVKTIFPAVNGERYTTESVYHLQKNYIVLTDENGYKRRVQYTPLGNLGMVYLALRDYETSGDTLLAKINYDALNRVQEEIVYDGMGSVETSIRAMTTYTYDQFGRVTKTAITDCTVTPHAVVSEEQMTYQNIFVDRDEGMRKVSRVTKTVKGSLNAPDIVSITDMDQAGQALKEMLAGDVNFRYTYDKLGNNLTKTDANGTTICYAYDYESRNISTSCTVDGDTRITTTSYDTLGNKIAQTDYLGNTISFTYDALGRQLKKMIPFDSRTLTEKNFYDPDGKLTRKTLDSVPVTKCSENFYDALGRITEKRIYTNEALTSWLATQYTYDKAGRKTSERTGVTEDATQQPLVVSYTYDRMGNILTCTDNMGGVEQHFYDATGRRIKSIDRRGTVTQFSYDALDRVISKTASSQTSLGVVTNTEQTVFALNGKTLSKTNTQTLGEVTTSLTTSCVYNDKGLLVRQNDPENAVKRYTYTPQGLPQSFMLHYGEELAPYQHLWYVYDALGQVISVRSGGSGGDEIAGYTYNKNGAKTNVRGPNGLVTLYEYNKAGLATHMVSRQGETLLTEFTYTYSTDGRCLSKTDKDSVTVTYEYDCLSQLVKESDPNWDTVLYTYDRFGNRTQKQLVHPDTLQVRASTTYAYDGNNRLMQEQTIENGKAENIYYGYDANGNQIYKNRQKLQAKAAGTVPVYTFASSPIPPKGARLDTRVYNAFGQLLQVCRDGVTIRFAYRPDGLRHSKETSYHGQRLPQKTIHLWNGQDIVMEIAPDGRIKSQFLRAAELVAQVIGNTSYYYLYNAHGDVVQRISDAGVLSPAYEYDAFGNQHSQPNAGTQATDGIDTDVNPFRYCGEYFDRYTSEYYLRNRDYCPENGRFTTEDPKRDRQNWYIYCGNDPVDNVDPTGEAFWGKFVSGIKSIVKTVTNIVKTAAKAVASAIQKTQTAIAHAVIKTNSLAQTLQGVPTAVREGIKSTIATGTDSVMGPITQAGLENGHSLLPGFEVEDDIYVAKMNGFQRGMGYNEVYDKWFDIGTNMDTKRFTFTANKTEYMIQIWKGDYLNLGAGAEMGLYKYSTTVDGIKQYEAVSPSEQLPMQLSLVNNVSGQTIFSRSPSQEQWWITGFDPGVAHPLVSELTASGTIDFSDNINMYNAFKAKAPSAIWSFDNETKQATFTW